ncbi:MAG: glycosyltransferase [Acidimicrobiales bacterium]|jgi:UDP-N-acetylglucosamine:LPS N-acetylglucosamine transferase
MKGPVVITGGGTGGHVFPMQAIAEQLRALGLDDRRLRFVGSRRGQEAALLGDGAVELTLLPGRGVRRSWTLAAVRDNIGAIAGLVSACAIALVKVGRWRPAAVVSVGGYASFPSSLAAVLWRRPLVLVDLDAAPGATHRVLARFAARRCTAFDDHDPRSVTTGAPLRASVLAVDRSPAARQGARAASSPPIDAGRAVVVVMTGSLGSRRVNLAVSALARRWERRRDRTLIHVTGRRDYDEVWSQRPATSELDYRIIDFADMSDLWALCDVALCRSGATTVAELTALGIASVLVPLPGAPGDHQSVNASVVAAAGGARVIEDGACSAERLAVVLDEVLAPATLTAMSAAAASIGRRDAAAAIAKVVLDAAGSR